jgi:radical SAM superfamily enzyme YgiQ (UPF0313 family)
MKQKKHLLKERGQIYDKGNTRLSIGLVYPNAYAVGMANLGFQTVYRLFNEIRGVRCERVFFDSKATDVRSFESGRRLHEFDIIAFSLSFELDYLNVVHMLFSSGIPLRAGERDTTHPLIMAGGVSVTLNPEILAECIDLYVIGESEELLGAIVDLILIHSKARPSRQALLKDLAQIPGIYVPRFYTLTYNENGTIAAIGSMEGVPQRVRRQYLQDVNSVQSYSPILSNMSHFKEMLLTEMGRGCPRGCRFCASGFIYAPVRFRSAEGLLSLIATHGGKVQRIGLVGSALSDHPQFEKICREVLDAGYELGVSSFRADALRPSLIEILVHSGLKTLTLAPETGSEEYRRRIHKNLTDDEILMAVQTASDGGLRNLKLYFLIGLPLPGGDDVPEIVALIRNIHDVFFSSKRRGGKVTVSIHPFVPKAWTPFQWSPMKDVNTLAASLDKITMDLGKIPGLQIIPKSPRRAVLQGLFSVGDLKIGEALRLKIEHRLPWKSVWKQLRIDPAFYIHRDKGKDEILPWEVLDGGIDRQYLWDEYRRAVE